MYGPLHTKAPSGEARDTLGLPWRQEVTVLVGNHKMTVDDPTEPVLLVSFTAISMKRLGHWFIRIWESNKLGPVIFVA